MYMHAWILCLCSLHVHHYINVQIAIGAGRDLIKIKWCFISFCYTFIVCVPYCRLNVPLMDKRVRRQGSAPNQTVIEAAHVTKHLLA